jgi:hypothetical protein
MEALAYELNHDPVLDKAVSSVVDSACMTIYAEPFYRGQRWGDSNKRLLNAGLTHDADRKCHEQAILIHKAAFGTKRRTSLAINEWDIVEEEKEENPWVKVDHREQVWKGEGKYPYGAYEFVEWAQQKLTINGNRMLEIQNNGLGPDDGCTVSPPDPKSNYWCYIAAYPGPKGFQTENPKNLGIPVTHEKLYKAIENGISMGANFIELPKGYDTDASKSVLACFDENLELGTSNKCYP